MIVASGEFLLLGLESVEVFDHGLEFLESDGEIFVDLADIWFEFFYLGIFFFDGERDLFLLFFVGLVLVLEVEDLLFFNFIEFLVEVVVEFADLG